MMRTVDFHYELPAELIAQHPTRERDGSRLMVLDRGKREWRHGQFRDLLRYLEPGDLLVLNDSRVIPARMRGMKVGTGGAVEVLIVDENRRNDWWAMVRPGKRVKAGTRLRLVGRLPGGGFLDAIVREKSAEGRYRLEFLGEADVLDRLSELGEVPLPPYIERCGGVLDREDGERYQTVYARVPGSVAAPTAGLHFTQALLDEARARGVGIGHVTLHVGWGTFAPVKTDTLEQHPMHAERYELSEGAAEAVWRTREAGGRVVAVGTTTLRVLESAAMEHGGQPRSGSGQTSLFVYPPFRFRVVDALVTNFHLPESTLLMLVSAFASPGETAGREWMLAAYGEAVRERYRFFSYGDAMLIL